MSKKTERKNKTNITVNWPTTPFFTVDELIALNSAVKPITLRVRLQRERDAGRMAEIGAITGGQGRPKKVFACTPVSQTTLDLARSQNIMLIEPSKLTKLASAPAPALFPKQPVTA